MKKKKTLRGLLKLRPLEEHGTFALSLAEIQLPEYRPVKALFPSQRYFKDYIVHYNLDFRWN